MFGTDDVIFVPEGGVLAFDEAYRWKRYKFDVRRMGLRIRPEAFETASDRIRSALKLVQNSPRFAQSAPQIAKNADALLAAMAELGGSGQDAIPGSLDGVLNADRAAWWVRATDLAPESFAEEDYDSGLRAEGARQPYPTYGTVHIAQLDGLEVPLEGKGDDAPFLVDVPEGALSRWTIPPTEPLPIAQEFCGARGSSARGRTVNIDTHGNLAPSHHFCTPLGRHGNLLATLYVHAEVAEEARVLGPLKKEALAAYIGVLEKSNFAIAAEGPTWRIYAREGDVVHLYNELAGKESEGVETMPPLMVVASAGGETDPMPRAELFDAIRDAAGG